MKQRLVTSYISVSEYLEKHEPTLTEFQNHSEHTRTDVYDAFESFTDLKNTALFQQGKQLYKKEAYLREQYIENGRSMHDIAQQWDTQDGSVHSWLEKYGIEARSRSEARTDGDVTKLHDRDWLYTQYINKERNGPEIADECGVCTDTVYTWLEKHGIDRRDVAISKANGDIQKARDKQWLKKKYIDEGCSTRAIAEICGVAKSAVITALNENGIEIRDGPVERSNADFTLLNDLEYIKTEYENETPVTEIADTINCGVHAVYRRLHAAGVKLNGHEWGHPAGVDHPQFQHKKTDNFGPNWDTQKLRARIRDHGQCQVCGIHDGNHISVYGRVNHVHHIQPRAEYIDANGVFDYERANRLENLITLCSSHHKQLEGLPIDNRHL